MSNEQAERKVREVKGRQRTQQTQKREGAKKLDLSASSQLFQEEFYIYWPDPSVDITKYEQDDGTFDVDSIPAEDLIEFTCRYIDPGTFQEILSTPLAYDLPEDKSLNQEQVEEIIRKAVQDRLKNSKTEADIRYEVLQACVIDPQFESVEQIKKILPVSLQMELYDEITRGAIGDNLVARFQEPH